MKFVLKEIDDSHIESVCEIEKKVFHTPYSVKTVTDDMHNPMCRTIVATVDGGEVAAYCMTSSVLDEASIDRIAVAPAYRRMGAAKLLIDEMINHCRTSGISFVNLEVRQSNSAARSLYEKSGFEQVGVRKRYYADNAEDAVLYTLNLKQY